MQYIGELCRFLVHAPVNPNDSKLTVKYAFGNGMTLSLNTGQFVSPPYTTLCILLFHVSDVVIWGVGLRADVWESFRTRYGIGRIIEFYSATEANVALFNSTGKVGALGCVPRVVDFLYPAK